jgi:hypothetical protein
MCCGSVKSSVGPGVVMLAMPGPSSFQEELQMNPAMPVLPSWSIPGLVSECRELKTKDQKRTWAYSVKVIAFGGTFEVQTQNEDLYKSVGQGEQVILRGHFEQFNGVPKLILSAVERPGEAAATAKAGNGRTSPAGVA